jgi:hypothetical protein
MATQARVHTPTASEPTRHHIPARQETETGYANLTTVNDRQELARVEGIDDTRKTPLAGVEGRLYHPGDKDEQRPPGNSTKPHRGSKAKKWLHKQRYKPQQQVSQTRHHIPEGRKLRRVTPTWANVDDRHALAWGGVMTSKPHSLEWGVASDT